MAAMVCSALAQGLEWEKARLLVNSGRKYPSSARHWLTSRDFKVLLREAPNMQMERSCHFVTLAKST